MDVMLIQQQLMQQQQFPWLFNLDAADPDIKRKIFIGGLAMHTSEESIRNHFRGQNLDVEAINLVTDKATGRSRGFGFITFRTPEVVEFLLVTPQVIDGKRVDIKRATVQKKQGQVYTPPGVFSTRKLFCGGLPPDITREQLIEFFAQYGPVTDCVIMCDRNSGRPRGFGFIVFESEEAVENIIANYNNIYISGKWVECKRAAPRDLDLSKANQQNGQLFPTAIQPTHAGQCLMPSFEGQSHEGPQTSFRLLTKADLRKKVQTLKQKIRASQRRERYFKPY